MIIKRNKIHICKKCKKRTKNFYALLCKKCYIKKNKVDKIKKSCLLCKKKFISYKSSHKKFCCLSHAYYYRSKSNYIIMKNQLKLIPKDFLLWFIGFWEGEGSLTSKDRWIDFGISQKDYAIINTIKKLFKVGKIVEDKNLLGMYSWHIYNYGATSALLDKIIPYIKLKHRKQQIKKFFNNHKLKELKKYV